MKKLYRPVGLKELELILESNFKGFPPRLPQQPIFYPVLNYEHAKQIAEEWNLKDPNSGYCGFVTEFMVKDEYINQFEEKTVGGSKHKELWIPAEELEVFNSNIIGDIRIVDAFYGNDYKGIIPKVTGLKNMDALQQLVVLTEAYDHALWILLARCSFIGR